jgi:DNA-directed RNA polymerase alpha subunit
MDKLSEIEYEIILYNEDQGNSKLEINIKGKNINYIIINTIRRAILTYVPIYAFTEFNFTANESIFTKNQIKLRIKNLPVWGIINNIDKIENQKKIEKENFIEEDDFNNIEDNIDLENNNNLNSSSLNQLTMYIDYKSSGKEITTVTTDHAKFYYDGKNIESPYKVPIPIVKLQPDQIITFSALTTLGNEKENTIFSPVSVCYYKENSENNLNFIIESRGQINEKRILDVAIINIINTIELISKMIPENESSIEGEIILDGENNTIGNLLSYGLQNHKHIKFAGYNVPHLLQEKIIIHYELIDIKYNIKNIFNDVIIYFIELFNQLLKLNKTKKSKKN